MDLALFHENGFTNVCCQARSCACDSKFSVLFEHSTGDDATIPDPTPCPCACSQCPWARLLKLRDDHTSFRIALQPGSLDPTIATQLPKRLFLSECARFGFAYGSDLFSIVHFLKKAGAVVLEIVPSVYVKIRFVSGVHCMHCMGRAKTALFTKIFAPTDGTSVLWHAVPRICSPERKIMRLFFASDLKSPTTLLSSLASFGFVARRYSYHHAASSESVCFLKRNAERLDGTLLQKSVEDGHSYIRAIWKSDFEEAPEEAFLARPFAPTSTVQEVVVSNLKAQESAPTCYRLKLKNDGIVLDRAKLSVPKRVFVSKGQLFSYATSASTLRDFVESIGGEIEELEAVSYLKIRFVSGVHCMGCMGRVVQKLQELYDPDVLLHAAPRVYSPTRKILRLFFARNPAADCTTLLSTLAQSGFVGEMSTYHSGEDVSFLKGRRREKVVKVLRKGQQLRVVWKEDVDDNELILRTGPIAADGEEVLLESLLAEKKGGCCSVSEEEEEGEIVEIELVEIESDEEVIEEIIVEESDEEEEDETIEEIVIETDDEEEEEGEVVIVEEIVEDEEAEETILKSRPLGFRVSGMTCAGCSSKIQHALTKLSGVVEATVNVMSQKATVVFEATVPLSDAVEAVLQCVEKLGYGISVAGEEAKSGEVQMRLADASQAPTLREWCERKGIEVGDTAKADAFLLKLPSGWNPRTVKTSLMEDDEVAVDVVADDYRTMMAESLLRKKEIRFYLITFVLSALFVIPAMVVALISNIPALRKDAAGKPAGLLYPIYRSLTPKSIVLIVLASPIQLIFGWSFYIKGIKSLFVCKPDKYTLITVSAWVAYLVSWASIIYGLADPSYSGANYMEGGAMLISFLLLGHLLENLANRQTARSLVALLNLRPEKASLVPRYESGDLTEEEIELKWLWPGDVVRLEPGSRVPADGIILQGDGSVDQSMLTGESLPVAKKVDDDVIGGTVVSDGLFYVRVSKVSGETVLSKIIHMIEDASRDSPKIQATVDTISGLFVPVVVVIAILVVILWTLLGFFAVPKTWLNNTHPVFLAILQGAAVLIVACPCALGLAVPLVVIVANGIGADHGVLLKGGGCLERLNKASVFCFDKTGTITEGKLAVDDMMWFEGSWERKLSREDVLRMIGRSENCIKSGHPIAEAVLLAVADRLGDDADSLLQPPESFENVPGRGILTTINGSEMTIGNKAMMTASGVDMAAAEAVDKLQTCTVVFVAIDGVLAVALALSDQLKPGFGEVTRTLKESWGKRVVMLTGDNEGVARTIGAEVGIVGEDVRAGLTPFGKSQFIKELQQQKQVVCFVGDGINDSIGLTQADVGVSVKSGTDVAVECSDIVLMNSDPLSLLVAVHIAKRATCMIYASLFWAFAYNTVTIPVAAGALFPAIKMIVPPWVSAILMTLSSLSVTLNAVVFRFWYRQPFVKKE